MNTLILASASPRRQELLNRAGLRFDVLPAAVNEFEDALAEPGALVHHNALLKARAIAGKHPASLVIGSDTAVFHNQVVLGKPKDMAEAHTMIRVLSGSRHTVYTGVALVGQDRGIDDVFVETSEVVFKTLDDACIDEYFSIVNPLDKAGSYGIQAGRELIIESYTGSLSNIMGLPIESLLKHLDGLGVLESLKV